MSDITIEGQVYTEKPIKHLIIDGKVQDTVVIYPNQLQGKTTLQISIEADLDVPPEPKEPQIP